LLHFQSGAPGGAVQPLHALPGVEHQIVVLSGGEASDPGLDGPGILDVMDRDERASDRVRAGPLEHLHEQVQFAAFRYDDVPP
jgi:hypothetical protein